MFENQVENMVDKAAKADNPDAALKFSQAALNTAHAMQVLALPELKNPKNARS